MVVNSITTNNGSKLFMNKITQRQLVSIMQLSGITMDMSLPFLEIRDSKTREILADVWNTGKGDPMDYELFTTSDRIKSAAGIETFAEEVNRRINGAA